jgi:hypothetical protein
LDDFYVTFTASVFRSVRFGAGSAHGKANMITFNTLVDNGAVIRQKDGTYKVDVVKMRAVIEKLAGDLLILQGNGDEQATADYLSKLGVVPAALAEDLERVNKAGIPVDLIFNQGAEALGL